MNKSWFRSTLAALCAITLSVYLAGCFTPYNTVRESFDYRAPLDSTAAVTIIYAREVPVLPENLELVATIGGVNDESCVSGYYPDEWTEGRLEKWARELGANVVYVQVAGSSSPCIERIAEFLVEKNGGKNEKN